MRLARPKDNGVQAAPRDASHSTATAGCSRALKAGGRRTPEVTA